MYDACPWRPISLWPTTTYKLSVTGHLATGYCCGMVGAFKVAHCKREEQLRTPKSNQGARADACELSFLSARYQYDAGTAGLGWYPFAVPAAKYVLMTTRRLWEHVSVRSKLTRG